MSRSLLILCAASLAVSCSPAQDSAGNVLENAGSVVKSGSDKLWIDNTPENSAGSALKNAGEVVGQGGKKVWGDEEDKDRDQEDSSETKNGDQ